MIPSLLAWLALQDNGDVAAGAGIIAALGAFLIIFLLIFLAVYLFVGFCLMKIAEKTNTENGWWGFVPLLNILLLLNIAGKPLWWIVLFIVPLVNIIVIFLVMIGVAEARGKGALWGVITAIFPIVGLPYLAFSE